MKYHLRKHFYLHYPALFVQILTYVYTHVNTLQGKCLQIFHPQLPTIFIRHTGLLLDKSSNVYKYFTYSYPQYLLDTLGCYWTKVQMFTNILHTATHNIYQTHWYDEKDILNLILKIEIRKFCPILFLCELHKYSTDREEGRNSSKFVLISNLTFIKINIVFHTQDVMIIYLIFCKLIVNSLQN